MTRTEIYDMLILRGFKLRDVRAEDFEYTAIDHNGEQVGAIWEDSINIAKNYPSLTPGRWNSYANTDQQSILFMSPMKMLEAAIDFLLDSPSRIDREMREKRVENIKKYFDTRKERREMMEWMV